jgi:RNA polymerase sigma-70 factor (ECF subfamily)
MRATAESLAPSKSDPGAFLDLYLPDQALLRAYLLSATGNLHEAEDLLQEVSRVLWAEFARYDPERPFRAWALGVARLQVLKWRQGRARRRETLSGESLEALAGAALEAAEEVRERRTHLEDCVGRLGGWLRDVVRLRYADGLSLQDIARRAGRSFAAVGMALLRARGALRDCVDRKVGAES